MIIHHSISFISRFEYDHTTLQKHYCSQEWLRRIYTALKIFRTYNAKMHTYELSISFWGGLSFVGFCIHAKIVYCISYVMLYNVQRDHLFSVSCIVSESHEIFSDKKDT